MQEAEEEEEALTDGIADDDDEDDGAVQRPQQADSRKPLAEVKVLPACHTHAPACVQAHMHRCTRLRLQQSKGAA